MGRQKKLDRISSTLTDEEKQVLERIKRRDFIIDSIIAALAMVASGVIAIGIGWILL